MQPRASSRRRRSRRPTCPYPANAPPHTDPIVVTVKITSMRRAPCRRSTSQTAPQPVFDDAVLAAAQAFRFEPARYGGNPVPVEITFTHTFLPPPPPPPPPPTDTRPRADLGAARRLVELGTRAPVAGATVTRRGRRSPLRRRGRSHAATSSCRCPAGAAKITVYRRRPQPVPPEGDARRRSRSSRSRTTSSAIATTRTRSWSSASSAARRCRGSRCAAPEIKQVPGTFGDPFRVSRRCPASRRWCRCCRSRSSAARARARPGSCSTARACRCSTTCCRARA